MPRLFALTLLITLLAVGIGRAAPEIPEIVSNDEIAHVEKEYGLLAANRLRAWRALVIDNYRKPERLKLKYVNEFFNGARFVSDQQHWQQEDYWATPIELLATDAGDCEDFVIAKYFTLKAMGVPENKLYLTYVKALRLQQAHMVLTYFKTPKSIPLVLDNLTDRILQANTRKDLVPIYSFNGDGLWLSKQRGKGKAVEGGNSQLKNWHNLLKKMQLTPAQP